MVDEAINSNNFSKQVFSHCIGFMAEGSGSSANCHKLQLKFGGEYRSLNVGSMPFRC